MSKIAITEEMPIEKEWREQARQQTLETLPEFIRHLMNDYQHDYGTVCYAIGACAAAAAWAANLEPGGGITGFQAGFVMWEFIRPWMFSNNECGMRLIDYDDMLYPQYEDKFVGRTISSDTWAALQKKANENLDKKGKLGAHPLVIAHWKSIADGKVPFGYTVKDD